MSAARLYFDNVIFCDDVRVESTGKLFLIGVYPSDFTASIFPFSFRFVVHTQGSVLEEGSVHAQFILEDADGGVMHRTESTNIVGDMHFVKGRFVINTITFFVVHKPTLIKLNVVVNGAIQTLAVRAITSSA